MRAPFALDCSPSPASITPAFTSSSLYFPISVNCSVVGRTPASLSALAFTSIMNLGIVVSPQWIGSEPGVRSTRPVPIPRSILASNEGIGNRHACPHFFKRCSLTRARSAPQALHIPRQLRDRLLPALDRSTLAYDELARRGRLEHRAHRQRRLPA